MPCSLIILGSTGSIGVSALRVLDAFPDDFTCIGLSCNSNIKLFRDQLERFRPRYAAVADCAVTANGEYQTIKKEFPSIHFFEGTQGLIDLASTDCDILLSALVGASGCAPALAAANHAKRIALANKETLVMAGELFIKRCIDSKCELIPVDSEHSAVFSLLESKKKTDLERIILTASGGSLRDLNYDECEEVSVEQALSHPTWSMGAKITIDSATLMNKGFEVIEAHHLFDLPYEKIDVVIHPESVIHSMVEMRDGSVFAHMGVTDMALPILHSLMYPEKKQNSFGRIDFTRALAFTFKPCDFERYPALGLCIHAGKTGATAPAVLNAANEIAVRSFLNKEIQFNDIVRVVSRLLDEHKTVSSPSLDDIFEADTWARARAVEIIRGLK